MCVVTFSANLSETFLILRIQWDIIIDVHRSSRKAPVIHVRFHWNFNFPNKFSKNRQIPNSMKMCLLGAELFHVDRWMDG
jgi:hypothetical protein